MIRNAKYKMKDIFLKTVNMPLSGFLYRKIYSKAVKRGVNNFKISDLIVTIEPSNTCNSSCVMCPYPKMTRPKTVMPMDLFKKVVDECVSNGINKFNLNFYNEPFLDPMIFERIEYLKLKGVRIQLFSNGSVCSRIRAMREYEGKRSLMETFNSSSNFLIFSLILDSEDWSSLNNCSILS